MNQINSFLQKYSIWFQEINSSCQIVGPTADQLFTFFSVFNKPLKGPEKFRVVVFPTIKEAEKYYDLLKNHTSCLLLPEFEYSPYTSFIQSELTLFHQFSTLTKICLSHGPTYIFATINSLSQKLPPPSYFKNNLLTLNVSDIISPEELSKRLYQIGYQKSSSIEEPGQFQIKGEIFDIFPLHGPPLRIHYFDDMIEEIFKVDIKTGRTLKDFSFESINLCVSPRSLSSTHYSLVLRENLPRFQPSQRSKYEAKKQILNKVKNGFLFENYINYIPLFFHKTATLLDYLEQHHCVAFLFNEEELISQLDELRNEYDKQYRDVLADNTTHNILPEPTYLHQFDYESLITGVKVVHINNLNTSLHTSRAIESSIHLNIKSARDFLLDFKISNQTDRKTYLTDLFLKISEHNFTKESLFCLYRNDRSKNDILHLIDLFDQTKTIKSKMTFIKSKPTEGIFLSDFNILILTENELFRSQKKENTYRADLIQNTSAFVDQLSQLEKGDYVIHAIHGIGKYLGFSSISIGKQKKTDFIEISYKDDDKIYVPVYRLDLIQKYADASAKVNVSDLKSKKFENVKNRAKASAKKLAFDLLRIQAERKLRKGFAFSSPDEDFYDFSNKFPFEETADQLSAVSDVLEDMQKPQPMDRLICGDVGFGKTEVAMRAAYKAVLDNSQVAILVPTTILSLQHFESFKKRFQDFPVNIDYLSRFKKGEAAKKTINDLAQGKIDIIIGTHKLLSNQIIFNNLGLVIVDEEHRFGVGHKEKLKLLKANVDFLTMTATPIPRTLQLSFMGIKDLSIIRTPPPRRQSIKSYVIKEDSFTIQQAITRELKRGGQVFIVHNRVQDIEIFTQKIQSLVPQAKIVFAHGQMSEAELESRITKFYQGHFDILVSTTIIESGLDIPRANTMIIDRADTYGLAQLHQLRGRIGRSDKKAYAYFVVSQNKDLTSIASKRLEALQKYADIGAGFSLANSDLEIRGAGDVLGPEQSGHISNIGLEHYIHLLEECIREIKGQHYILSFQVDIQVPFPSYIPSHYIEDEKIRLKYYKNFSLCQDEHKVDDLLNEIEDIYGKIPQELHSLGILIKAKTQLAKIYVSLAKLSGKTLLLQFDQTSLDRNETMRNKLISYFTSRPKKYKLNPNFTVSQQVSDPTDVDDFYQVSRNIAEQIFTC